MPDPIRAQRGWPVSFRAIQPYHIGLLVSLPPARAAADALKVLKGVIARGLFQNFPALKTWLWGGHLCTAPCCVGTAGNISAAPIRPDIERPGHFTKRRSVMMRAAAPLGSQMCGSAIFRVCKADKAQTAPGRIKKDLPVPAFRFDRARVPIDKRICRLPGDRFSLHTLDGRITVPARAGKHPRRILESGTRGEAETVLRKGKGFFNRVVESGGVEPVASGPVMGVDVGANHLVAHRPGKVFRGERLRDQRDRHLALRHRIQSNASRSAKRRPRQVFGKGARDVKHITQETSQAIVGVPVAAGVAVEAVNTPDVGDGHLSVLRLSPRFPSRVTCIAVYGVVRGIVSGALEEVPQRPPSGSQYVIMEKLAPPVPRGDKGRCRYGCGDSCSRQIFRASADVSASPVRLQRKRFCASWRKWRQP